LLLFFPDGRSSRSSRAARDPDRRLGIDVLAERGPPPALRLESTPLGDRSAAIPRREGLSSRRARLHLPGSASRGPSRRPLPRLSGTSRPGGHRSGPTVAALPRPTRIDGSVVALAPRG